MGERFLHTEEVDSSILSAPTKKESPTAQGLSFFKLARISLLSRISSYIPLLGISYTAFRYPGVEVRRENLDILGV